MLFFVILGIKQWQFLLCCTFQLHHWRRVNIADQSKKRNGAKAVQQSKTRRISVLIFCIPLKVCMSPLRSFSFLSLDLGSFATSLLVLMIDETSISNNPKWLLRQDIPSLICICLKLFVFPFFLLCFIPKGKEVLFREALEILSCF